MHRASVVLRYTTNRGDRNEKMFLLKPGVDACEVLLTSIEDMARLATWAGAGDRVLAMLERTRMETEQAQALRQAAQPPACDEATAQAPSQVA